MDLRSPDRRGDAARVLFERHVDDVRVVCRANMRDDPAAVEDMVNETFVRLLANAERIREGHRVDHWLVSVAKNVCIDSRRRRYRSAEVPIEQGERVHDGGQLADTVVEREFVRDGLSHLSPNDRTLLAMRYLDERTYGEIAEVTGSTYQSIKARTHNARRRLRHWVDERAGALIPVPLMRWLRGFVQQLQGANPPAWQAVGALIVATAISLPLVGGGAQADAAASERPAGAQIVVAKHASTLRLAEPAPVRARAKTQADRRRATTKPTGRRAAITRSPQPRQHVDIPLAGTGHGVRTAPPDSPPDYQYRVVSGDLVAFEAYNEPELQPVNEPACEAVAESPALVSCSSAR